MTELDSARPQAVATWRRSRRIHFVAALVSVLAAGCVLWMFDTFGIVSPSDAQERLLIASVDLRIGDPAAAAMRARTAARDSASAAIAASVASSSPRSC